MNNYCCVFNKSNILFYLYFETPQILVVNNYERTFSKKIFYLIFKLRINLYLKIKCTNIFVKKND